MGPQAKYAKQRDELILDAIGAMPPRYWFDARDVYYMATGDDEEPGTWYFPTMRMLLAIHKQCPRTLTRNWPLEIAAGNKIYYCWTE